MNQRKPKTAITPTRSEDYPEWYQQVVRAADLAENAPVRGCMVIKPWGYAIWENIQRVLDGKFKATGHKNAYFPLFIPLSYLEKEAQHVEGFAKECAVVTHHRLEQNADGKLVPTGKLEEPLVVRPTSETIIGDMFSRWVQSYRDLPILINQWANVVRWEMRPRLFLRTTEFLWQEGHTAHASQAEAEAETRMILDLYADFAENWLGIPVIKGTKTPDERFPGAVETYSIEAMMQDGKALQAGTSHFLGQNFSKVQNISFAAPDGSQTFCWTTSWGVSTRLIGGLVMTHSDDDGLVLPPKIAPTHVVILPIWRNDEGKSAVLEYCETLQKAISAQLFNGLPIQVEIDARDLRGGEKMWQHVKRGVPVRVEVGPREVEQSELSVARRDVPGERQTVAQAEFLATLPGLLEEMQQNIFRRAETFRREHTRQIDSLAEFREFFIDDASGEGGHARGFAYCHYAGSDAESAKLLKELKVTPRCLPVDGEAEPGKCLFTGQPSTKRIVFGKSY